MRKQVLWGAAAGAGAALLGAGAVATKLYASRLRSVRSLRGVAEEGQWGLYDMHVDYPYNIDRVIRRGIFDDQSLSEAIVKEALPLVPAHIGTSHFGCSAASFADGQGNVFMLRNYDYKDDTSALLVHCAPKHGYRSVATAALNKIGACNLRKLKKRLACLTAPFICLDGVNEKGVAIAILTLDSEPVFQQAGKPVITPTLAVRLVLDRAASTAEAVELLRSYDMCASAGRDYHYYIADAQGDARVVEYDCDSPARELVATPVRAVTNFYALYRDRVEQGEGAGAGEGAAVRRYGHGLDRCERIEEVLDADEAAGRLSKGSAWRALEASSQPPRADDVTSNTQWSIVYNLRTLGAEIVLRRDFSEKISYGLGGVQVPARD